MGFGIDFAVRIAPPKDASEASGAVGEFFWDGAASTLFWVDPKNDIAAVLFTQMRPFDKVKLHKTFRDAVYRNDPRRARALKVATDHEQPLGFGFIGAGAIANFHARAVAAARGGALVGVVSRRRGTARGVRAASMAWASRPTTWTSC